MKIHTVFRKLIAFLFTAITVLLYVMALRYYCKADIRTYYLERRIGTHQVPVYFILSLALVCVFVLMYQVLNRSIRGITGKSGTDCTDTPMDDRISCRQRRIALICAAFVFMLSVFWMLFYDGYAKHDQLTLYNEAVRLAGFSDGKFNTAYMTMFKRQRAVTLLMALGMRLIHSSSPVVFKLINAAVLALAVYRIGSLSDSDPGQEKRVVVIISVILTGMYIPSAVCTSYLYGTSLAFSLSALAFCRTIHYVQNHRRRDAVLAVLCYALGISMHQSAAIALVAGCIYVLLSDYGVQGFLRSAAFVMAAVVCMLAVSFAANTAYESITGAPKADSLPATATIYMGLTADTEDGGPGSQDGSFVKIFEENDRDGAAASADAMNRIRTVIGEYFSGERDWHFFVEKTKFQWLDPTFGARKIIVTNDTAIGEKPNHAMFTWYYSSSVRELLFRLGDIFMIAVFGLSAVAGGYMFLHQEQYGWHFLLQLYVVGGFVFQLMWETLSRYCYPYYIWLIPEAILGVSIICRYIPEKFSHGRAS